MVDSQNPLVVHKGKPIVNSGGVILHQHVISIYLQRDAFVAGFEYFDRISIDFKGCSSLRGYLRSQSWLVLEDDKYLLCLLVEASGNYSDILHLDYILQFCNILNLLSFVDYCIGFLHLRIVCISLSYLNVIISQNQSFPYLYLPFEYAYPWL